MKRISILSVFILLWLWTGGQTLNLRYDFMGLNRPEVAWSVESEEDGAFTIFLGQLNLDTWNHATGIARFDNSSTLLWERNLGIDTLDIYTGGHNSAQRLLNSEGYLLGAAYNLGSESRMYLVRYAPSGDTLWTRYWSNEFGFQEIGYSAIEDPDGNFLVVGVGGAQNGYARGLVVKTDPDGNTLWKRYYTGYTGSTSSTIFATIESAYNGGYIVGGGTRSCGTCPFQHHLVRLNSEGDEVWQKILADNSNAGETHAMHYGEGIYFASGWQCIDPEGLYQCKPYLIRFNDEGDTLWTKTFGDQWLYSTYTAHTKRLSDDHLVAVGEILHENYQQGLILKYDIDGNEIWRRIYANVEGNACRFNDFTELTTGELVAVGVAWPQGGDQPLGQDTWILKTDEYGCLIPGCHVSVEELEKQDQAFLVGPNPASDMLTIYLPGEVTRTHYTQFVLTDLMGKQIKTFTADTGSTTYMLDVQDYAAGIYLLSLVVEDGVVQTVRVVVE